jgi:hypothetical protein
VTKQELSQLYYLNREIEYLQNRIKELDYESTLRAHNITGMPKETDIKDVVGDSVVEVLDLKKLLKEKEKKCFEELKKINIYINSVDDSQMRLILALRYINRLSWQQIAFSIGINGDGITERKKHDKFLKKLS